MAIFTADGNLFTEFKENLGLGNFDLSGDTFGVLLTTSAYTPDQNNDEFVSDITNEVTGNGYARQAVTPTWAKSGSNAVLDFTDPTWTASGGSITARRYVIFKNTGVDATSRVVGYGNCDATPADVVITDGNTGTLQIHGSGFFQI